MWVIHLSCPIIAVARLAHAICACTTQAQSKLHGPSCAIKWEAGVCQRIRSGRCYWTRFAFAMWHIMVHPSKCRPAIRPFFSTLYRVRIATSPHQQQFPQFSPDWSPTCRTCRSHSDGAWLVVMALCPGRTQKSSNVILTIISLWTLESLKIDFWWCLCSLGMWLQFPSPFPESLSFIWTFSRSPSPSLRSSNCSWIRV